MISRRTALGVGGLALAAAAGCQPTSAPASSAPATPTPSPTTSPSATPSSSRDFMRPGEARKIVEELVSAAGTIQAVKVEIEQYAASMSVVSGMDARTYAWRAGHIGLVDSDTKYVGQAIFDPRDYAIDDLAALFESAADVSKSRANQQLQIVEFVDREIFMTVTTNPESVTVFFRRDASMVSQVDLASADGIGLALADVVGTKKLVLALGVLPGSGGCFVDGSGGEGVVVRTVRAGRLPARQTSRREQTTLTPFDPSVVNPTIISRVLDKATAKAGMSAAPWSLTVDRRGGFSEPRMYFTVNGADLVTTMTGVDITPR